MASSFIGRGPYRLRGLVDASDALDHVGQLLLEVALVRLEPGAPAACVGPPTVPAVAAVHAGRAAASATTAAATTTATASRLGGIVAFDAVEAR
jgi:hypothetical protein